MGKQEYYVQISTEPEPEGNFLFVLFRLPFVNISA